MSDDYKMPHVYPGQIVMISKGPGDSRMSLGFVQKVANRSLSVNVLSEGWANMAPIDDVRHVTDPHLTHPSRGPQILEDSGCWQYSPETLEKFALRKRVDELTAEVAARADELASRLSGQEEIISRLSRPAPAPRAQKSA